MKIGIISDTHDNIESAKRAATIFREEEVDYVFHLGDFVAPFTLRIFEGLKLYGVFGNNDGERLLLSSVARELNFVISEAPFEMDVERKKFLLLHGWGSVDRTRSIVDSFAKSGNYDFVLYGHTHRRDLRKIGNTRIINPGEACGYLTGTKSIALLNLDDSSVRFVVLD